MAQLRPLGQIMEILEKSGHPITHAYDDLIFVQHIPFLLQFSEDKVTKLYFYGHVDWDQKKCDALFQEISSVLAERAFTVVDKGRFEIVPNPEQKGSIDVLFYDHELQV